MDPAELAVKLEGVDQRSRSNTHCIWAVLAAGLGFLLAQIGIA